jgi:hypothetical protein
MTFKIGDLVRRTGREGPTMRRGSVWEVVGIDFDDGYRIRVPRNGWYAADGFVLDTAAPEPVVNLKATPHKWAKEIKAWADGADIEWRCQNHDGWTPWRNNAAPSWTAASTHEYRIKPEKKPNEVKVVKLTRNSDGLCIFNQGHAPWLPELGNLKLTFDGETGKLKAVQLLSV